MPAQPLGDALNALAQQAGLQIVVSQTLVAGRQAPAVSGRMEVRQALERLLAGSGLAAQVDGNEVVIHRAAPSVVSAALPEVTVAAGTLEPEPMAGATVYTREQIANTPASNRDLSGLLENHPAVRIDNAANAGGNRGSMDVADISFHGASPYQNLFQIDGMDASNNINPANKNLNLQIGNVPSNSQAYFVDTSLLEEVKVFDSFVPAEYGRFNGGVVDSRLRRASGQNGLKLSYRFNNSGLTRQKVGEALETDFANGAVGYSPKWRKHFISATGEYNFSEDLGVVFGLSRRQSRIQRYGMSVDDAGEASLREGSQDDLVDNLLSKFSLRISPQTTSDLTIKYSARKQQLVDDFFRDTRWDYNHNAYGLAWDLGHAFTGGRYKLTVGYDRFLSDRNSDGNELVTSFYVGQTSRNYTSGGFGREETSRDTWTVKNRIEWDALQTGAITHTPYAGLDVQHIGARFKRHQDAYSYQLRYLADGSTQERSKSLYHAGTVDLDYQTYGLYLSDRMTWRNLTLDLGLRYDRETFIDNGNISPRTRLDWDALGNGNTVLSAGWNRYYGDSILQMGLQENINTLRELIINSSGVSVNNGRYDPSYTRYQDLRTPYDDEWAFQLLQRFGGMEARLGYVHRNGRDQIAQSGSGTESNPYVYNNLGRSRTHSWSLGLANATPWHGLGAQWRLQASASYERTRTNSNLSEGYQEGLTSDDPYIIYNGERILRADKPGVAFNRPSQARLDVSTRWGGHGVTLNNALTWKSARDAIAYVGLGAAPERLERYESTRVPAHWTWDASISWAPRQAKGLELTLEVLNLLDKQPVVVPTSPIYSTNRDLYRSGREIWLQVGYQF
ncbi:TonB-dependent receptor [Corticibacter populi]|uniref:TonB-dependent receptor n=1 Tax=Corticibacter populi TaxID=1550736 RepID=A0A3M6QPW6_9BURK|nr:TonB-dependent receptor [Corticibacter populi]